MQRFLVLAAALCLTGCGAASSATSPGAAATTPGARTPATTAPATSPAASWVELDPSHKLADSRQLDTLTVTACPAARGAVVKALGGDSFAAVI